MSAKSKKPPIESLALRISVLNPPPNISWALQLNEEELVMPAGNTKSRIFFDFSVEVVPGDSPDNFRLRGAAVQGRRGERFVYLRMGAYAGQVGAVEGWRAKISVEGITRNVLDAAMKSSGVLEAQIEGTARDGGPARASVPLLGKGWVSVR